MWNVRVAWDMVARIGLLVGVGALAGCGISLPWVNSAPQQNCKAGRQGTLGAAGGVIVPLSARDPTDTAHNVSALYAVNGDTGALAWSCASTTFYGWDDVQQVNGVIYALAGTEENREGVVTRAHAIYAIRPSDGKQVWAYSFMAGLTETLAFGGAFVFVTTATGGGPSGPPGHNPAATPPPERVSLLAIHADSGALAWSKTVASVEFPPVAVAGQVVVAINNGANEWSLQAFNGATGAPTWSYQLSHGAADLITLAARDGALYAQIDRSLIALDGATGVVRWTRLIPLAAGGVVSAPNQAQLSGNAIIVPLEQSVAAYDLATGAPLWSAPLGQWPNIWVAPDQHVYTLTSAADGKGARLVALDGATGRSLWRQDISNMQWLGLTPAGGGDLYLTEPAPAKLDERVVALDGSGGARWSFDGRSPYNYGRILASGDHLYYIWQAPDGVDGANQADITYVTCLNTGDGATRWQMPLPGVNGDPIEPLLAP